MSDKERLDDLLFRWEQMFEQGQDVPPEELCRDCPEMIPSVRQSTEDLKRMDWLKRAGGEGETISLRPRHVHTPTSVGVPRLIAGQYRLDELLGEGGFGQVWRGVDLKLKRPVAVKVPKSGRSTRPGGAEAFLAEAQKVARLEHPGIVPVHAVAQHGSAWFIVSKLIEGTDLRRRLADGRVPVREAVRIVVAVAEALTYAHERNIVHRDIKPSNLLVDHQGGVYVTDFGIALDLDESSPTDTQAAGTLGYMAPEQFLGESGVIDARTDIYGLGVVLYEMLTGLLPFPSATLQAVRHAAVNAEPPPPRTIDAGVPKEIQRICLKCLAKSPEGRYQTAQALTDDLAVWLNPRKRRYLLIGAMVASCLVASILAAGWFFKDRPPSDGTRLADEKATPSEKASLRLAVGPPSGDEKRPVLGENDAAMKKDQLPVDGKGLALKEQIPSGEQGSGQSVTPPTSDKAGPVFRRNDLDIETVFANAEKYATGLVEFDRVRLHGAIMQEADIYDICRAGNSYKRKVGFRSTSHLHEGFHKINPLVIETRKGLLIRHSTVLPDSQNYFFYAPGELAVNLRKQFDPKKKYLAKITCHIEHAMRRKGDKPLWLGRVVCVSLYGPGDKAQGVIACDAEMLNNEIHTHESKSTEAMFVVDGVSLSGEIGEPWQKGSKDEYTLALRTRSGIPLVCREQVNDYVHTRPGLTYYVTAKFGDKLQKSLNPTRRYRVRMAFKIPLNFLAEVNTITLLDEDGREGQTFRDTD